MHLEDPVDGVLASRGVNGTVTATMEIVRERHELRFRVNEFGDCILIRWRRRDGGWRWGSMVARDPRVSILLDHLTGIFTTVQAVNCRSTVVWRVRVRHSDGGCECSMGGQRH